MSNLTEEKIKEELKLTRVKCRGCNGHGKELINNWRVDYPPKRFFSDKPCDFCSGQRTVLSEYEYPWVWLNC